MSKVVTVCVSLEPEYVKALDRVARSAGSRSAAVRRLLAENAVAESRKSMEAAYREYFSDPEAVKSSRDLSRELLQASSWIESRCGVGSRKGKRGRSRGPQG